MVKYQQLTVALVVLIWAAPVYANQAKDAYNRGVRAEHQANYDEAWAAYKEAYTLTPTNPKYLAAYTRVRFDAAAQHVRNGQMLRNTGALSQALVELQRAAAIDSSSFIAQQEIRATVAMMNHQEEQRKAPKPEPPPSRLGPEDGQSIELRPLSNARMAIHLTATADVAYKTVGKLAGLNVIIDPDYRPQKITVDLNDVTLPEVLEAVRLQSKTFWRPLFANTIMVGADSPAKRKELEQQVMKTFYLHNINAPAELQDAANVVRQILDIPHIQLLQAQDALIVRGTPDQLLLAEKLLADVDKPKSEVIVDVTVMQVSRDRIRNLGTTVPTSASIGLLPKVYGGSGSGSNSSPAVSGANGGFTIGSFVVSVPGASATALASDSNTKILQNPQIRVLNNEKATLRIGDRVPIATGSFQPGIIGGGGVSPLIGTQFTYLDVGVNVDITPHIHADNSVTLKMSLEISSVTGQQNIGGITQPIIGQRRIEHEAQLTDGEVNLVGGILEDSETKSLSGYPWLSKLPLLRYLFAQDNRDRTENEIVFAITPHIVREMDVNDENRREIAIGTGNSIQLQRNYGARGAAADPSKDPDQSKLRAQPPKQPGSAAPQDARPIPVAKSAVSKIAPPLELQPR